MTQRIHWQDDSSGDTMGHSRYSGSSSSAHSRSTAPTDYSYRPSLPQHDTCYGRVEGWDGYDFPERHHDYDDDDEVSIATYASTIPSEAEGEGEEETPEFEVPDLPYHQVREPEAIPATPRDFSDLFPSTREMLIAHDDSTIDGNMNLRLDVPIKLRDGREKSLTLFHLRMHDLRNREFSLRRYCRDSGREVCHTVRKYQKPAAEKRPAFQRSFSNALATLRSNKNSNDSNDPNLRRHDSGYESVYGLDSPQDESKRPKTAGDRPSLSLLPTNTIKLEFSNYAHIDVKRRGAKTNKRYEFEYWGHNYAWRRITKKEGDIRVTSYHLLRDDGDRSLAQISPIDLTRAQSHEETAKGGWIPPCSMQIVDESILSGGDTSDVVVSTGIVALVDDSIKQRFHTKQTTQLLIPLTRNASFKMNMESIGPKRLIDEVFHRAPRVATGSRPPAPRRRPA